MSDPFFRSDEKPLYILFFAFIAVQVVFSFAIRPIEAYFETVPPIPTESSASIQFLGDRELAYRVYGTRIQHFGDTGSRQTSLKDYDFERLSKWFFLQHKLNPRSNYIPFIASYLFGGSQDASKLPPLIDYLEVAGTSKGDEKWRWLAQAVYLTRFKLKDYDHALFLAQKLSDSYREGMPTWTKHMPAFVQLQMGEKEASYQFMKGLLVDGHGSMHPNEVNFMIDYICNRVLDPSQAKLDPLCEGSE